MGDQMVQVTRWVTRIPPWPELGKLGCQLGRDQNIWLSVSVIIFLHHLIFAQKAQLLWRSGHQSGHLEWSGLPWAIWSSRSNLVAHQVIGALGRLSGRGKCIQLKCLLGPNSAVYDKVDRWIDHQHQMGDGDNYILPCALPLGHQMGLVDLPNLQLKMV